MDDNGNFKRIFERPTVDEAPSNLINISKYVLPKHVIDAAREVEPNPARGEYEITDVINQFVSSGGRMAVLEAAGDYLDGGTLDGWLHANNVIDKHGAAQ